MHDERTLSDTRNAELSIRRLILRVLEGPDAGLTAEPEENTPTVGTAEGIALRLGDPRVSRYHVELRRADQQIRVRDLSSRNGTFVGAVRVHDATVPAGTRLQLGHSVVEVAEGALVRPESEPPPVDGLVGASEAMREVRRLVQHASPVDATVLLEGETGTGKEVVARAIHAGGSRADGPFEVVDCGSLPPTLVASELFGHERGAFTGAHTRHVGAFERANGGTVFLDELGEMPLDVQPLLLGVLERRRLRRVGGRESIPVDVRVIAATHRDLRHRVNEGSFRADLYYRVSVLRIVMPSLRERIEDLDALVAHFAAALGVDDDVAPFGRAALHRLRAHAWPGNVRELRNVVEATLALGTLDLSLPAESPTTERYRDARARVLSEFERSYLLTLMARSKGNASEAARLAEMDRPYLLALLRRHGLRD